MNFQTKITLTSCSINFPKHTVRSYTSWLNWCPKYTAKVYGHITLQNNKDSYSEISEYFGIPTVEQLITNRHDRFLNRYRSQENCVCQALIT